MGALPVCSSDQFQRHFCARLPANFCAASTEFAKSKQRSAVVTIRPGHEAREQCKLYGLPTDPIQVRLIKVKLQSGKTEILATSLLDESEYRSSAFRHLYHRRWGVGYRIKELCFFLRPFLNHSYDA